MTSKPPAYTESSTSSALLCGKSVEGIRQQIISNAVVLFPSEIKDIRLSDIKDTRVPRDYYDVLLVTAADQNRYKAILTLGTRFLTRNKTMAEGAEKATTNEALCSLLEVTANALEKCGALVLEKMDSLVERVGGQISKFGGKDESGECAVM